MASFTIAVASVSGSATAPRTAARAHRVAASRVPAGSLGRGTGVAARRAAAAAAATDRPVVLIDNYDSFTFNLSQVRSRRRRTRRNANAHARRSSPHTNTPTPHDRRARERGSPSSPSPLTDERKPTKTTLHDTQYLGDLGCDHVVVKNDEVTVDQIRAMNPIGVMVGPGPGTPEDSGIALEAVKELGPEFGVFGVCMGHQCIGQVFGGRIIRAPCGLMHGKSSPVWHKDTNDDDDDGEPTLLRGLPSPFNAARYHSLVIARDGFPDDELEITAWTEDETIMAVRHRRYPKIQGVQFHPESIITESGLTIIANWVELIRGEDDA